MMSFLVELLRLSRDIWRYILKLLALAVFEVFQNDCLLTVKSATIAVANAICSRQEVADDIISGEDAEKF